jgi:hypothetical protein
MPAVKPSLYIISLKERENDKRERKIEKIRST